MINFDEESLMCDLAETYQIYDYKQLPLPTVAVFSCGLSENSRIKMKLSSQQASLDTILLAGIKDALSLILWSKTKDGVKGINEPKSILEIITGQKTKEKSDIVFNSGEDFEKYRNELLNRGEE